MRVSLRFHSNDHAWCKVVGIHRYAQVPENQLRAGVAVNIVHDPDNPVDGSAVTVLRPTDGAMIGHLRYQVADIVQDVIQNGWTATAVLTGSPFTSENQYGEEFRECKIELIMSCNNHHNFHNVVFLVSALHNKADDYPYDRVHLWR